jgi:hypothetical protein
MASAVPLVVLGDRIARAVGPTLPFDQSATFLATTVGKAGSVQRVSPTGSDEICRRALSAARSGRAVLVAEAAGGIGDLTAVATVDLRVTGHTSATGWSPSSGPPSEGLANSNLTVLVVDSMATEGTAPGFVLTASATVVERPWMSNVLGLDPPDQPVATTVDGAGWFSCSTGPGSGAFSTGRAGLRAFRPASPPLTLTRGSQSRPSGRCRHYRHMFGPGGPGLVRPRQPDRGPAVPRRADHRGGPSGGRVRLRRAVPCAARPDNRRASRPLLPDRGVGRPGHCRGAGSTTDDCALAHLIGTPQAGGPLSVGRRGRRQ